MYVLKLVYEGLAAVLLRVILFTKSLFIFQSQFKRVLTLIVVHKGADFDHS